MIYYKIIKIFERQKLFFTFAIKKSMKTLMIIIALFFGIILSTKAQHEFRKDDSPASNCQPKTIAQKTYKAEMSHLYIQHQDGENLNVLQDKSPYFYVYDYSIDQRRELLQLKHQAFYHLPYPDEYIRNTVMPSIRNERTIIAPHFPERSSDIETDRRNMNQWLRDYTDEFINYLMFLDEQYIMLKNELK